MSHSHKTLVCEIQDDEKKLSELIVTQIKVVE
jgi:hypothetical protein